MIVNGEIEIGGGLGGVHRDGRVVFGNNKFDASCNQIARQRNSKYFMAEPHEIRWKWGDDLKPGLDEFWVLMSFV